MGLKITQSVPLSGPTSVLDWREFKAPPVEWLIPDLLAVGDAGFIHGLPSSFKSFFALQLCVDLAANVEPLQMWEPGKRPFRTLLIQAEGSITMWQKRLMVSLNGHPDDLPFFSIHEYRLKLDLKAGTKEVDRVLEQLRPDLLIIDPIATLFEGDDSDPIAVARWQEATNWWRHEYNVAVLWIHHDKKPTVGFYQGKFSESKGGVYAFRGRSEIHGWADFALGFVRHPGDILHVEAQKIRNAPPDALYKFRFEGGLLLPESVGDIGARTISRMLRENSPQQQDELVEEVETTTGKDKRTIQRAIRTLLTQGKISREKVGKTFQLKWEGD